MKEKFKVNTGITSIMMIFVVLCLTAFGILSYSMSAADLKLSEKNRDSINTYYETRSYMEKKLAKIDEIIMQVRKEADYADYYDTLKEKIESVIENAKYDDVDKSITVSEKISEKQQLVMKVNILPKEDDDRYSVEMIKTQTKTQIYEPETMIENKQ